MHKADTIPLAGKLGPAVVSSTPTHQITDCLMHVLFLFYCPNLLPEERHKRRVSFDIVREWKGGAK